MTTVEMINKALDYLPGLIVSVRDTTKGDRFQFRYNTINTENGTINFGQANAFQEVSFNPDDIADIVEVRESTIHIVLKNGEKFALCLGEYNPQFTKMPLDKMDIEDFISNLKKSLSVSVNLSEQDMNLRFLFDKILIKDSDDDMDWPGDREITIQLSSSDDENHFNFKIDEYDTNIKIVQSDENSAVVMLDVREMPFTKIMLVMNYVQISVVLPIGGTDNFKS